MKHTASIMVLLVLGLGTSACAKKAEAPNQAGQDPRNLKTLMPADSAKIRLAIEDLPDGRGRLWLLLEQGGDMAQHDLGVYAAGGEVGPGDSPGTMRGTFGDTAIQVRKEEGAIAVDRGVNGAELQTWKTIPL